VGSAVIGSGNINLLPNRRAAPLSDSTPNFAERIGQFRKTSLAYTEVSGSRSTVLARTFKGTKSPAHFGQPGRASPAVPRRNGLAERAAKNSPGALRS
jgi:hypothetical protein